MINEKKDACYHKVKSRYSVWPSAYASGALVKCRKKGAKNWGNSRKDEALHTAYFNFAACLLEASVGRSRPGSWRGGGAGASRPEPEPEGAWRLRRPRSERTKTALGGVLAGGALRAAKAIQKFRAERMASKNIGSKRMTPTPEAEKKMAQASANLAARKAEKAKAKANRKAEQAKAEREANASEPKGQDTPKPERSPEQQAALDSRIARTTPPRGTENRSSKRTEVGSEVAGTLRSIDKEKASREKAAIDAQNKSQRGTDQSIPGRVLDRLKDRAVDFGTFKGLRTGLSNTRQSISQGRAAMRARRERIDFSTEYKKIGSIIAEKSAAWTRSEGKNPSGGLNAKGVASYRANNPGSKLKTAVTTKPSKLKKGSKAAKRRKSFCARMKGMRARQKSSNNTGKDRLSLSLKKWNC